MKNKEIFRQVAVSRLSSPDELDVLLRVTSPRGWIALGGALLLIGTALVWSVFGRLPTKLTGQQCILVKNGGVNAMTSSVSGRLADLAVEPGDSVIRGQIIGRLEPFELLQKIKASEARQREAQAQYDQTLQVAARSTALDDASREQQARFLATQLASTAQRGKLLKERIDSQRALYDQGLITRQTLISSELELAAVQLEGESVKGQIKQLELARLERRKQSDNEVQAALNQLEDVKRQLGLMAREAKNSTSIVSPYSGRVLEVKATEGQLVERGTPLISIESSGVDVNELEAFVYLPAADGKKIRGGMKMEISPSTARREEFGFMPAFVAAVADYPSTDLGLMRVFGNDKLVQQLSGAAAPIQVRASLKPSPSNSSGYAWSTREGPPFSLQSGTTCSASITLSEQRPIELVLPVMKKLIGLD